MTKQQNHIYMLKRKFMDQYRRVKNWEITVKELALWMHSQTEFWAYWIYILRKIREAGWDVNVKISKTH